MSTSALRRPAFRRLYAATTIDSLGSWLLVMAVPLQAYRLTGSTTSTGLTLAVEALPAVLVTPLAGTVLDRWPRTTLMIAGNLAAAGGAAIMLLATTQSRIVFLYAGLVLENAAACLLRPAAQTLVPASVGGTEAGLATANTLSALSSSAFRLLGPPAGALLVTLGRFDAAVLADVASYLAAAALVTGLFDGSGRSAPPHQARPAGHRREGVRHWRAPPCCAVCCSPAGGTGPATPRSPCC